ncbi:ferredoxin [Rhodococcus qingshengii]|uniref:ferredoxin n=1 Tax=Rhodococcus qingshengii TaxID=334542 RepID=UPI003D2D0CD7
MRITIDRSKCQGHAQCAALSGGFYELDDYGFVSSESGEVATADERAAKTGASACPERAIAIE